MEDFVPFKLARKLVEKGFDWETSNVYERNTLACRYEDYPKPTISDVLKWLREEKKIHIVINITNYGFVSSTISFKWDKSYCENEIEHYDHKGYSTYEDAALTEIEYVLDNLI